MGFLDVILGRTRPARANLDALFAVPNAAVTLSAALGFTATGDGAVCYRAAAGATFAGVENDVVRLLATSADPAAGPAPKIAVSHDEFGFSWLEVDHESPESQAGGPHDSGGLSGLGAPGGPAPVGPDLSGLCTDLHAVNTALEESGYGPGLLCSLIPFSDTTGRRVGLVYLYKQGTFYAFAPVPASNGAARRRESLLEIQVRDALAGELSMETDSSRALALWGAPGL